MVSALPVHHPLRLIEEICMLDHSNGGRLEIGHGRCNVVVNTDQGALAIARRVYPIWPVFVTCSKPAVVDLLS